MSILSSRLIRNFIFLLFLSCSIFSQDIRYPNNPVHDNPELIPFKIQNKDKKKFNKLIRKYFFLKPEISYKDENYSVYLLGKKEMRKLEKSNISYESFPKSAPFKYYDKRYDLRVKKNQINLEELRTGYKDERLNIIYLKSLAEMYPNYVKYFEIGETRLGRVIPAIKITSPKVSEYKIPILFTGAHHANELISTEHCYDIIYHLLDDYEKYEPYLENLSVWIVPIVNPDGSYFFWNRTIDMGRKNGYLPPEMKDDDITRGVDLNRNYPFQWNSGNKRASSPYTNHVFYRGPSPASEPETKAMISLAKKERFLFAMSFHSFATSILFPYTIENVTNPEPDYVKDLANRIVKFAKSKKINKEFTVRKNIYPVDGTDQDYYYHRFGTNAFIAESSHHNPEYSIVPTILKGFKEVWENLLFEFFISNKIILKIQDNLGNPISAKVKVEEIKYYENEVFSSHPDTGLFIKMFLDENDYTFHITKKGYEEKKVTLKSGKSQKPNLIILNKQ